MVSTDRSPSRYFDGLEAPSQIFWLAGDLDGGPATHDLFQLSLVSCRDHKGCDWSDSVQKGTDTSLHRC